MLEIDAASVRREAEEIVRHPAFPQALQLHAAAALDTFEGRPRDTKLVCQTARYVTLFFILYLDTARDPADPSGGATVKRLQDLVATGPFASASWVKLTVGVFRRTGLIEDLPSEGDRRHRRFRASPQLISLGREALERMMAAVATVRPLPCPPVRLAGAPGAVESFARLTVETHLHRGFTMLDLHSGVAAFLRRDFGHLVFIHLVRTMRPDREAGIVADAPPGELARRYGMSRGQVRNLLTMAGEAGLLSIDTRGGRAIRISPGFAEAARLWVAADLAWMHFLACATAMRLELDAHGRSRRERYAEVGL